jgi:hypothetical protein
MPTVRLGKGNKREEIMGDKNTLELSPWFSSTFNTTVYMTREPVV